MGHTIVLKFFEKVANWDMDVDYWIADSDGELERRIKWGTNIRGYL